MGYNSKNTGLSLENVIENSLLKNNNEEYTPTQDYNPATKKYVDDFMKSGVLKRIRSYTTSTTVSSLNVEYEAIYVQLTQNDSLSVSSIGSDYNGRTITAYVYTQSEQTITIPTTGDYVSMCGSSFTTKADGWVEFNLTCVDGKWHIAKLEQE